MSKELDRGAGILLPVSSLPSPYGIGTLGKKAYEFVDMLKSSGQMYWQVLPVLPIITQDLLEINFPFLPEKCFSVPFSATSSSASPLPAA